MDALPDFTIPTVLSFLAIKDTHKCAAISKEWGVWVQRRLIRIKEEAAQKRMQMTDDEKRRLDKKFVETSKNGKIEDLQELLADGADVNARVRYDWWMETALMNAVMRGRMRILKILLDHGANIDATEKGGQTALTHAARLSNIQALKFLLENGADVNATTESGRSPLMEALLWQHRQTARCGQPVKGIRIATTPRFLQRFEDVIRALLCTGANPNIEDNLGRTALSIAQEMGCVKVVEMLKAAGARD